MAKHTPGPWVVDGYRIYGPKDDHSKHLNGRALIGGVIDGFDARLIAAAPEMLRQLREVRVALEELIITNKPNLAGVRCGSTTLGNHLAEVRAVIKKAGDES